MAAVAVALEQRHVGEAHKPQLPWRHLAVIGVLAALVRIAVALRTVPHRYDMGVYTQWAQTLVAGSPQDFYQRAAVGDHLPGDVVLHLVLGRLAAAVAPETWAAHYPAVVRSFAIVFDLGLVASLIYLTRVVGTSTRATVRLGYAAALMPGFVIVSAWWGQWDALSSLLVVLAIAQALRRRFYAFGALATWAFLVKPQTSLAAAAALLSIGLVVVARRRAGASTRSLKPALRDTAVVAIQIGVGALLVAVPLCALFGVNPLSPGDDGLLHRLEVANGTFTNVTLGATNFWHAALSNSWVPDSTPLFGLPIRLWGQLLAVSLAIVAGLAAWRARGRWTRAHTTLWLAATFLIAFYMVITRCHERYLFPALVLCVAATAVHRSRLMGLATTLYAAAFAGTVLMSMWTRQSDPLRSHEYIVLSWINVLATVIWLAAGLRRSRRASRSASPGVCPYTTGSNSSR